MLEILEQIFYSDKYDYLNIVLSLCEVAFTILSILTIFISIYYENCILKLKKLKWKIKQTVNIDEIKEKLFEYGYIKDEQIPFYDRIILFFRVICYILLIIYSIIYIAGLTKIESIGGIILTYLSVGVVLTVLIYITTIFRTSKKNEDILDYKDFFDYENFQKIYNEKLIIVPNIKINIMHNEYSLIQIEQTYPIYMYNLLIVIQLDNKVFLRISLKDNKYEEYNQTYKYNINIDDIDISKYIFENIKGDSDVNIYISTFQSDTNNIKAYKGNIEIDRKSENTIIKIEKLKILDDRITRIVQDFLKEEINKEIYNKLI